MNAVNPSPPDDAHSLVGATNADVDSPPPALRLAVGVPVLWQVLWVLMAVLTGTHLRSRAIVDTSLDVVTLARLAVFGVAAALGATVICSPSRLGPSGKALLFYLVTLCASWPLTGSRRLVAGYLILVTGAVVFLIRFTRNLQTMRQVERIEGLWAAAVTIMVLKDALLSLLASAPETGTGTSRLGLDSTSPAMLGLYAILAFLMFQNGVFLRSKALRFIVLAFLLWVLLGCRTRIVIIAFAASQLLLILRRHSNAVATAALLVPAALLLLACLDILLGGSVVKRTAYWFHRGQDSQAVSSLSGREQIWPAAVNLVTATPRTLLFGFGYGATRFHLNWKAQSPEFMASHCHNTFLEHFFATGLLGLTGLLVLMKRALAWRRALLTATDPRVQALALRAWTIMIVLLICMLTEVPVGVGRPGPSSLLLFLYVGVLDMLPTNSEPRADVTQPHRRMPAAS